MKINTKLKRCSALVVSLLFVSYAGAPVMAWGPERPTYTNEAPATHAVFNSITNNVAIGDERDFVRIGEKNSGRPYSSEIRIEPNKQYEVYIYYHNDAESKYNESQYNRVGAARDTRLASYFPHELKKDQRAAVTGKITAINTDPLAVWDEAYVTATEDMTLHYVEGTAKIYNQWGTNGSTLSTSLFSQQGTFLGLNTLNGVILGCAEYSGQVVYTIQTKAVDKPVEPEPTPDPEPEPDPEEPTPEPELPDEPDVPTVEPVEELPTAGAHEAVLAIVVVVALLAGVIYWRTTSHAVRKATRHAKGRK